MKNWILRLAAFVALSLAALAAGVMNNSTWSNATGTHTVTVTLEAQTTGNLKVTFTEGTNSGVTTQGTPDFSGGCADCPVTTVGNEGYRIVDLGSKSVVQWQNPNGDWITIGKKWHKKKHHNNAVIDQL